ncbi:MAG TPA: hypothetical protein P5186_10910 [Candidatus Paceibacterota bacterium]|nr:hypothetical protein [Verrucomicrobiota bacterium]HRY48548.1 hypothetical protein [Candidatus Paceibacterota bacterium]
MPADRSQTQITEVGSNRCCCPAMPRLSRRKSPAKRRITVFELLALAALWAIPWSGSSAPLPNIFSYRANDMASLRQGFAQPPREADPWIYWFWWNSVVWRQDIARALEEMASAGIAGAEPRVVTFHGWGGPPLDGMAAPIWSVSAIVRSSISLTNGST